MLTQLRELIHYNRWANERLLDRCALLSPDDLHRELGGSFPSVWSTLAHVYGAENSWLARWEGNPKGQPSDLDGINDIIGLRTKWDSVYARQSDFIGRVTEDDVRWPMGIIFRSGLTFEQQIGATIRHCVNHSTYHRGQVTNFLRMLGAEVIGLDLVLYYMDHPPA